MKDVSIEHIAFFYCWMDVEFWISYVKEFQIELSEKTKVLLNISKLGLATYNWYVDDDRNILVCTSEEKVKDVCE